MEDKLEVPEKFKKVDFENNMFQHFGKGQGQIAQSNCAHSVN